MNLQNILNEKIVNMFICRHCLFGNSTLAESVKLPKGFENYKTRAKSFYHDSVMAGNIPVHRIHYDLDGDKIADVIEARIILGIENGEILIEEYPLGYWFDINKNKKIEDEEILHDPQRDGLNGNEFWYTGYNKN